MTSLHLISRSFLLCTLFAVSVTDALLHRSADGGRNEISQAPSDLRQQPIPKIIHMMWKGDPRKGFTNPIWNVSFTMWHKYFPEPEYQYMYWNDTSMVTYFNQSCPEHSELFFSLYYGISRSDLARYCILSKIGGIYSDMDYEPRQNFFADLHAGKVNLIESPYEKEIFQNSLMASPAKHPYWLAVLDKAEAKRRKPKALTGLNTLKGPASDPVALSGPQLLDDCNADWDQSDIHMLPCAQFQQRIHKQKFNQTMKEGCEWLTVESAPSAKGIHWSTWSWVGSGKYSRFGKGMVASPEAKEIFEKLHPESKSVYLMPPDH